MLEAKLKQGSVLRKIVDSLKDLINEAKFEFTDSGMSLLSMDSSHVVLVSLMLRSDGFEEYRCDRAIPIGLNMASFAKIVRSAAPDDAITLRADNSGESLTIIIDSAGGERTSEYELKLMDLDVEQVTVPDLEYNVVVRMPSEEFTRVCRDLSIVGDAGKLCTVLLQISIISYQVLIPFLINLFGFSLKYWAI